MNRNGDSDLGISDTTRDRLGWKELLRKLMDRARAANRYGSDYGPSGGLEGATSYTYCIASQLEHNPGSHFD